MADALQMFLMVGSSSQLGAGSGAKSADSEAPLLTETLPFATQLAEAGDQPFAVTARQKTAAIAPFTEDLPTAAVHSESLEAILADEQRSADEKDAARAWLAIIRAGQQEKAGMTLTALSEKQGASPDAGDKETKSERISQLRFAIQLAGTGHQADTKESELSKVGFQLNHQSAASLTARVRPELVKDAAQLASTQLKTTAANLVTSEQENTATLMGDASDDTLERKSAEKLAVSGTEVDQIAARAKKTAAGATSSAEPLPAAKTTLAATDALKVTSAAESPATVTAATTAAGKDTKLFSTDSQLVGPVSTHTESLADEERIKATVTDTFPAAQADVAGKAVSVAAKSVVADSGKLLMSDETVVSTKSVTPAADSHTTTTPEVSQDKLSIMSQVLQQDGLELTSASAQNRGISADRSSQSQTLAAAVQARAEAQSHANQTAASSNEQKSGEHKEQSTAGAMLSAMQQAQAEKGKASGERFDVAPEQDQLADESSLQRVANSSLTATSLGQTGAGAASQPVAMAASTAQMVQSQGSASVQSASAAPTVSELLKQPLNLLAADASGQLRERLVMMVRNSVHSAEIKLDPAELGSMHIRVSMQQDQASVQFLVQQAHAKEILEQQLPRLRDMLGEQGIALADGQVSQQSGQQQQQQQSAGGNAITEDDESLMQEQRLPVAKPSNRLVDYYA